MTLTPEPALARDEEILVPVGQVTLGGHHPSREALSQLRRESRLAVVPGATHLTRPAT
ncbi:MAG: hypothetical protein JWM18_247 [Chloroflexi bacterium]|jgi:hypothetical protein|nr:hypothetical protein [Chloroflexota bacterium]